MRDQPGWRIVRRIPIMGPEEHGGHCELAFDGLEIPDENRLMERGRRAEADADPARPGAADALHALAGAGASGALEIAIAHVEARGQLRREARGP